MRSEIPLMGKSVQSKVLISLAVDPAVGQKKTKKTVSGPEFLA
jgi:hypothetical protein